MSRPLGLIRRDAVPDFAVAGMRCGQLSESISNRPTEFFRSLTWTMKRLGLKRLDQDDQIEKEPRGQPA